ncbi:MAG: hypothetical protein HYZ36_03475, partial [Pedosphaera parvula]|nr:hypothetical protein [Pedosphaera parvula]
MNPFRPFLIAASVLTVAFAWPLIQLTSFALNSYLYSHIFLIPVVSVWMIWMRQKCLPAVEGRATVWAIACAVLGAASLAYALLAHPSPELEPHHRLTWTVAAYVLALAGAGFWFLGW